MGSNDLTTDLGILGKYDDARYLNAVSEIINAANKYGKPVGIGGIGGRLDILERWFTMGASWSLSGQDGTILQSGMKQIVKNYDDISERVKARQ